MVARPVAVRPRIWVELRFHTKCVFHAWVRGLNSGADLADIGSIASVLVYLKLLQPWHASARLSSALLPPP